MAFAEVHFPVDKDQNQLPFWSDNDEQAITGDNFFDQFVTFDSGDAAPLAGEVLADPPSPSIILESLRGERGGASSGPLDLPPTSSHDEIPVTPRRQPAPITRRAATIDQGKSDPAVLAALARDPVLCKGSISDSELLHLEGISLQSSPTRKNVTAPSSPPLTVASRSPRKHNRFIEALYATIRRPRPKPAKQEQYPPVDMTDLDALLADPRPGDDIFGTDLGFINPAEAIKQDPINGHGQPLTPPLTGRISNGHHRTGSSSFATGALNDPFTDGELGAPVSIHAAKHGDINTPIDTPVINSEVFFPTHRPAAVANPDMSPFRHAQKAYHHRSTSSAEWPMEGILTDVKYGEDPAMWAAATSPSTAAYLAEDGTILSPNWGEAGRAKAARHHMRSGSGVIRGNAAHNLAMHRHQGELPYEYNPDVSGLMIHMPQPRTPQAGVLNINDPMLAANHHHHHDSIHGTPMLGRPHPNHFSSSGHIKGHPPPPHTDHRRPRPRAPSSGARHHGLQGSPRKLHHSMSMGHLRKESQSPPPPLPRHGHVQQQHSNNHSQNGNGSGSSSNGNNSHQERRRHRSASLTMRKQRSFTRRAGGGNGSNGNEPRTPASRTGSFNFSHAHGGGEAEGESGETGGAGGAAGFNFVNYTPNHGDLLMTGVAPSGSRKTKARREREEQERRRHITELARKVAGGDVDPATLDEFMDGLSEPQRRQHYHHHQQGGGMSGVEVDMLGLGE
ncbi:hypothetical protein F4777DRAFT_187606 [Nemania sp. FL0916]|nr:hypothetical protein F4777DRAFT_187606 [Nemania sp. FL0916]